MNKPKSPAQKSPYAKLNLPPLRSRHVPRPRLTTQLDAGIHHRLTLVSAPAGSGKTVLVSEWAHAVPYSVLWMGLDAADNDPARFWQYWVWLLDMAQPKTFDAVLTLLQTAGKTPFEDILRVLVDDLAAVSTQLALVLDDYHLITNPVVHDQLAYLIDHLPPTQQVIISSRADPPLPLNRWRLRGELAEITAEDLRFSTEEIHRFLAEVMDVKLPGEAVLALEQHTEGWIAGVQLMALSLRRFSPPQAQAFLNGFSGSQRYVFDYLAEEVLAKQTPEIRAFLLQTAILDTFDAALCDAVTAGKDGQKRLETLEAANLFLIPVDMRSKTHRYHHLFADFLRARLQSDQPELVPELHRRASGWHESRKQMREVVKHRLAMGDFAYAADVVNRIVYEMLASAEYGLLLSWLETLPENLFDTHPELRIAQALVLSAVGLIDIAQERLDVFERKVVDPPAALKGLALTVRSAMASVRGDVAGVLSCARAALDCLPAADILMRSVNIVTIAAYTGGEEEFRLLREALQLNQGPENRLMRITIMGNLSRLFRWRGDLAEAVRVSRAALQVAAEWEAEAGRPLLSTYYIHTGLADALYRLGQLDSAAEHAQEGLRRSKLSGDAHKYVSTYLTLAQIQWALGDKEAAETALQAAETFSRKTNLPAIKSIVALRTQLGLAEIEANAAQQWLETRRLEREFTHDTANEYITHAWALIVAGRAAAALPLLTTMLSVQQDELVVEILVLKAMALQQIGDAKNAPEALADAVARGFVAKDIWGIAQFGKGVQPLLENLLQAQRRGQYHDAGDSAYTLQLLRALGRTGKPADWPVLPLEPLTRRELEVLQLMAQGITNKTIGERLHISPHTVGNHARNIYDKLAVANRTQAVVKARELRLI